MGPAVGSPDAIAEACEVPVADLVADLVGAPSEEAELPSGDEVEPPASPRPASWWDDAVQVLKPTPRQVVLMLYRDERAEDEVARELGISVQAVHSFAWHAVKKLRREKAGLIGSVAR